MGVFNTAKVWTVDTANKVRSRPSSSRSRPRPQVQRPESRPRDAMDARARAVRNEKLGVWARLGAVAILGAAILWWPYSRTCGWGLAGYLAASSMIVVGGLWVVACTWIVRLPRTHALAMLVTLWGLGVIGLEVLPRVGYAKPDAAHPATWWCAAP